MGNVNIGKHFEELAQTTQDHSETLIEHIFPEDHVVSIDEFPEKWEELSKTATYHRTVIKF